MRYLTRSLTPILGILLLVLAACSSADEAATDSTTTDVTAEASETTDAADSTEAAEATVEATAATETESSSDSDAIVSDLTALFDGDALTTDATTVSCTLENGTETTCHQFEVASLSSTVDTDGPYCPETVDDVAGIWVWDGDEPGLYALDTDFWALMESQGYEFVDTDGTITVTDPGGGTADGGATANSCLEATPDGSFHLQVLLPTTPEVLDEPTVLGEISQVGVALDGVTIFGEAPSVADRGGLPALDACGGHIDPSGYFHWHFGAESIQSNLDEAGADVSCDVAQDTETLVGFVVDGYPLFGPEEDGEVPADLDECSGHTAETDEFGAVYHYHLTYESPNLPACRIGAAAEGTLTSPDNPDASLPSGDGPGGGGPGGGDGPPAQDG